MSLATTVPTETIPNTLIDDDSLYEIINGERVEKPRMGNIQVWVASILAQRLGHHARTNQFGRVVSEMLFKLNPPGSPQRRPDLAFLSYARWPRDKKLSSKDGFDCIPDLAIEVVSPSNTADEVSEKVVDYFQAGVRQVWVVRPSVRQIYLYESPKKSTILDITDELSGGELFPGFNLSLAELFEDAEAEI